MTEDLGSWHANPGKWALGLWERHREEGGGDRPCFPSGSPTCPCPIYSQTGARDSPQTVATRNIPGLLPPPGTQPHSAGWEIKGASPALTPSSDLCYQPRKNSRSASLAILGRGPLRETHCSEEDQSKPGGSPRGGAGPRPTSRLQGWHFQQMGTFYKSHISGQ